MLARAGAVNLIGFLYVAVFWYNPAGDWPLWGPFGRAFKAEIIELTGLRGALVWAVESWVGVLLPVLVLLALGRPLRALGMGRTAKYGWRIVAFGLAVAMPVQVWLGLQPAIQHFYANAFLSGGWRVILANGLVVVSEHVWVEGVLLATALPYGFPEGDEPERHGRLAMFGLGNTAGHQGVLDWLGVPAEALPAIVAQGVVFGLLHSGKAFAEFATAFPGGIGLGLLTWRIRSMWPSVLLHLGTGAVVLGTAWLASG